MKNISNALKKHLNNELTTLAICCKIITKHGEQLGFTGHQQDLYIDGLAYSSTNGLSVSDFQNSNNLSADNIEFSSIIGGDAIKEEDILEGKFNHAIIEIFMVNYEQPESGKFEIIVGLSNEIKLEAGRFNAEVTSFSRKLENDITQTYSKFCQAKFGDGKCKKQPIYQKMTIEKIAINKHLKLSQPLKEEFHHGQLKILDGPNQHHSFEIASVNGAWVSLKRLGNFPLVEGQEVELKSGCNKRFDTCQNLHKNALNFRGFPHLPGFDEIMKTSSTRGA